MALAPIRASSDTSTLSFCLFIYIQAYLHRVFDGQASFFSQPEVHAHARLGGGVIVNRLTDIPKDT